MIEESYLTAALLLVRCACHVLITLRIFTYTQKNQRDHRQFVGLVAAIFGGLNAMEFLRIIANFNSMATTFEPCLTGIMIFVLLFINWTGGNIAHLFPQKSIQSLPNA